MPTKENETAMPNNDDATQTRVEISADNLTATLTLAADLPKEMLNEAHCVSLIQGQGVKVTDDTRQAVRNLLAQSAEPGQPLVGQIAQAVVPVPGQDGMVQWEALDEQPPVDNPITDTKSNADAAHKNVANTNAPSSHYERSAFTMVKKGQALGKVIAPVPAVDGVDVRGSRIAAEQGTPVTLDLDETIRCDANGNIIAMLDGVFIRQLLKLRIRNILQVTDFVDFSTGHIDFDGEIQINKGVRDCFIVKATGDIHIQGLIEAATIECGGSLVAAGGFAGREQGRAIVGCHLQGKYLDNIQATVGGDLAIAREVVNCDLQINGNVASPKSAIMGGKLCVTGSIHVATLGSPAGVHTQLVLGHVPKLELLVDKLKPILEALTAQRKELLATQNKLEYFGDRATPKDRDKLIDITHELAMIQTRWLRARHAMDAMATSIGIKRTVELAVERKLHAGVCLIVQGKSYVLDQDIQGPVYVRLDHAGQVVYKQGLQKPVPLKTIARVKAV